MPTKYNTCPRCCLAPLVVDFDGLKCLVCAHHEYDESVNDNAHEGAIQYDPSAHTSDYLRLDRRT